MATDWLLWEMGEVLLPSSSPLTLADVEGALPWLRCLERMPTHISMADPQTTHGSLRCKEAVCLLSTLQKDLLKPFERLFPSSQKPSAFLRPPGGFQKHGEAANITSWMSRGGVCVRNFVPPGSRSLSYSITFARPALLNLA